MIPLARRTLPLLFVLASVGCGGDSHAAIAEDSVATMNEIASVLEDVDDKASAEAAVPKLEKLFARMHELEGRMDTAGEMDEGTMESLGEEYAQKMQEASARMTKAMMEVPPQAQEVLGGVLEKARMR